MRYFFIEQPIHVGATIRISGSDVKHIRNVLRLRPGDTVFVFNGRGLEYETRIVDVSAKSVDVTVLKKFHSTSESFVRITVAQAFLKEKKMDVLIRQLTELGIAGWIPFVSERSVSRPDKNRLNARSKRWRKIARESLKQCRRGCLPEITDTTSFDEMLDLSSQSEMKFIFWENESNPIRHFRSHSDKKKTGKIFLIIGPEGGFTDREVDRAISYGFQPAGLGPRILRTETATVAACALIQYLFGDMGQKNLDKKAGL